MRGYSKIKEGDLFSQRSKSTKEFPFLDKDFDGLYDVDDDSTQNPSEDEPKPNKDIDQDYKKPTKKNGFFLGKKSGKYEKNHGEDDQDGEEHEEQYVKNNNGGEKKIGAVVRRNFSVSSSTSSSAYQKSSINNSNSSNNNNRNSNLERQSSTRAVQEVVKRAFSMRRSSSVSSDRYCRIYDQSLHVQDFDNHDYVFDDCNHGKYHHQDDEFQRCDDGSSEIRSMKRNGKSNNGNGKMHVGSKVARACRRLFSR